MKRVVLVGVIGAGVCDGQGCEFAEEIGKEIARAGAVLICGGLGGVMEAAARGAQSAGGITVGILPGARKEDANLSIYIPIATNMGHARNAIIAQAADGLVAVGGGFGTISEIALGLKMGKPVVALDPPVDILGLVNVSSPREAVRFIIEYVIKHSGS